MTYYSRDDVLKWVVTLLAHPQLHQRIPMEAGVSFPALLWDEMGELMLTAFHYVVLRDRTGHPVKYATFSRVCLRAADLRVVSFATFDEQVLFKGMSLDAPYTVHVLDAGWHNDLKLTLADHFAELATRYAAAESAGTSGQLFVQQYPRLLPPSLMPYYRALSPHFFDWMQQS